MKHSAAEALRFRRDWIELGRSWDAVAEKHGVTAQEAQKCWYNYHARHNLPDPAESTVVDIQANVIGFPQQPANRYDITDPLYDIPDDTHRWNNELAALPNPIRLAFETDIHIGKVAGKLTHDPRAIELSLKPIQDFKPHVVVVGSDMFEFDSISHWGSSFDRLAADALKEVEKPYLNIMTDLRSAAPGALFPFLVGNHDWRVDENSKKSQYRYTLISDFVDMVRAGGALWQGFANTYMDIRSLFLLHGQFECKYAANKTGDFYAWEKDILFGHIHRFDYSFRQKRVCWGSASLASEWAHYKHYKSGWQQGFMLATIYHDHTQFTPLLFKDYKVIFGEKEYRA